ncbi:hypothetical protein [Bradyrhizobium nitroreducens]|uniref:hypothetical protein n=1 Tax=Bradyrhizobium nitroreducens TaxID=709803 RepID=UPI0011AE626D|nr:hypothetical protein [Bradyrhizobium nitroreducens]
MVGPVLPDLERPDNRDSFVSDLAAAYPRVVASQRVCAKRGPLTSFREAIPTISAGRILGSFAALAMTDEKDSNDV